MDACTYRETRSWLCKHNNTKENRRKTRSLIRISEEFNTVTRNPANHGLVWGQRGSVGCVQLTHSQHQDVFLLFVKTQFSARQPGILQFSLGGGQLLGDRAGYALFSVHPVGRHLSAHVVVQSPVGVVSQHLLQKKQKQFKTIHVFWTTFLIKNNIFIFIYIIFFNLVLWCHSYNLWEVLFTCTFLSNVDQIQSRKTPWIN